VRVPPLFEGTPRAVPDNDVAFVYLTLRHVAGVGWIG
jgi:hypothetical protein